MYLGQETWVSPSFYSISHLQSPWCKFELTLPKNCQYIKYINFLDLGEESAAQMNNRCQHYSRHLWKKKPIVHMFTRACLDACVHALGKGCANIVS